MNRRTCLRTIFYCRSRLLQRAAFGALVIVLSVLLEVAGFQQGVGLKTREMMIRGAVVNESGYPVPNTPVRLIAQRVEENLQAPTPSILDKKVIETRTDSKGLYEIVALIDSYYNRYVLSFYSENQFDSIVYTIPPDEDISSAVFKEGTAEITVNRTLTYNPQWPEIKSRIEELGANSDRGRILRLRGVPDKVENFTVQKGEQGELWWYYSKGFCYRFLQGRLDKLFNFNPMNPPREGVEKKQNDQAVFRALQAKK